MPAIRHKKHRQQAGSYEKRPLSRRGFTPFAIWRIIVGTAGLIALWLVG
nr:hypothetical protein [Pseudomonas mendocina]